LTNEQKLFKIIRTCFEKRRKTILNGLFSIGGFGSKHEIKETLDKLSISPNTRPESLSLQEFVRIAEVLQ
jgi:16S rRNA (adenine1518-N6/adenine1519-N6)-dimethyltransferase